MPTRTRAGGCCGCGTCAICACLPANLCLTVADAPTGVYPEINGTWTDPKVFDYQWIRYSGPTDDQVSFNVSCDTGDDGNVISISGASIHRTASVACPGSFDSVEFLFDNAGAYGTAVPITLPLPWTGSLPYIVRQTVWTVFGGLGCSPVVTTIGSGTVTVTIAEGECLVDGPADPGGGGEGFMARVSSATAAKSSASPVCSFRSADPLPAGTVADATGRAWYQCEKPHFERFALPVSSCTGCGVPVGRRCGPACPGFLAGAGDSDPT